MERLGLHCSGSNTSKSLLYGTDSKVESFRYSLEIPSSISLTTSGTLNSFLSYPISLLTSCPIASDPLIISPLFARSLHALMERTNCVKSGSPKYCGCLVTVFTGRPREYESRPRARSLLNHGRKSSLSAPTPTIVRYCRAESYYFVWTYAPLSVDGSSPIRIKGKVFIVHRKIASSSSSSS